MSRGRGHAPVRKCIACGVKAKKSELIRLSVGGDGQVIEDVKKVFPGRGAYIHDNPACRKALSEGAGLKRAFKQKDVRSFSPDLIAG